MIFINICPNAVAVVSVQLSNL